jgi:hypothetical protein
VTPPTRYDEIARALDFDPTELMTLRQASRHDPPRNCPMLVAGEEVQPGAWREFHADPITDLPVNCPVTPLGKDASTYYFLDTLGAVLTIKAASSGKGEIDSLFAGRSRFLEWAWPRWQAARSAKDPPRVKGFESDEARRDLFGACAFKGAFELEDRVRGRGAWRGDDGSLVYHAGNAVWIDGAWRACGEIGRHIYPGRPPLGRPTPQYEPEGPGSPGDAVLELLRTFNWERPELDARLALGWAMTAKIGGALDQRPVVYLSGEEGSGKTTLQKILRILMNGALMATSNTTQAGIYQRIKQDSVAVLVDENEPKADERASNKLLELARIAYSGDKMNRGDKDGVGREFALMSSFMASSIVEPAMDSQDASRMAKLVLRPIEATPNDGVIDTTALDLYGRQLLRRLFDWFPRWAELRRRIRAALIEVGHDSRSADTFAPLAAGAHVALFDDFPDAEQLALWKGWLKADELVETAGKEKTWRRCLTMMLQAQPDILRHETHKTVGDALAKFKDDSGVGVDDVVRWIKPVGLSVSFADGAPLTYDNLRLFVPAKHVGLHSLFEGTPWAGRLGAPGPWIGVLRQAPRDVWAPGKCGRGLDKKASGIFIQLAAALDA